MGDAKGATAAATGTVTAINVADRKITFNHGPIPEIKWPPMWDSTTSAASASASGLGGYGGVSPEELRGLLTFILGNVG